MSASAAAGRDTPGSNWHFYPIDPEGHTNEFYYGIEQIGWDGFSKPPALHKITYHKPPDLPHRSEYAEVAEGLGDGRRSAPGLARQGVGARSGSMSAACCSPGRSRW